MRNDLTEKLMVKAEETYDGSRSDMAEVGEDGVIRNPDTSSESTGKPKRTTLACIRCRTRHIRCPGGDPCKKCQLAKTKCEYVEADKKIVVSMKYLSKLHDDIARLKKDNALLRSSLKQEENKKGAEPKKEKEESGISTSEANSAFSRYDEEYPNTFANEVIQPSLDKHGRLIQSRTGEKVYVGSSSMTLFGLEIQNMVPPSVYSESAASSPASARSPNVHDIPIPEVDETYRGTEILEKEGNAYKITLTKTNTRPGLSINFSLPSYSYSMLLVDTFINYNDGCFYFFNEGLVKRFLMNLYSGKTEENKKILKRNISMQDLNGKPDRCENNIKKDTDDDNILETIWFCKILLIFAIGEMYLGTDSSPHIKNLKQMAKASEKRNREKGSINTTLPGSGFFYQASELFTGLFASGAIDNITKDGGIEVMLLYAFYLQVADCTIALYFYFGLALRSTLILGWHVDAEKENLNRFELEHRRRIWWTVYMYERMLSSKAGLPLSFADDSVSTELPIDFNPDLSDFPLDDNDVRGYYIFPSAEYINNCVAITQINAIILSSLYTKQPTVNILPVVSDLVHKLMTWKTLLPDFLKVDFSVENLRVSRLIVNLMTEYFQGMNLAVRPLLFHFATKKLQELKLKNTVNKYVDLTKYSKNVLTLLNASFQASINTIKSIWALLPENMVALFGWMDREYLFTSASTLILFNASFGVHDATKDHLDHALTIFTKMKKLGNYPAALRRAQLLKLIRVLDFNSVMNDLLVKHDDEFKEMPLKVPLNPIFQDFMEGMSKEHPAGYDDLPRPEELFPSTAEDTAASTSSYLSTQLNNDSFNFNFSIPETGPSTNAPSTSSIPPTSGDVYMNTDLAGIEGLTYFDEEQKLWSEITNDAVWLNVSGGNPNQPPISGMNPSDYFKNPLHYQSQSSDQPPTNIPNAATLDEESQQIQSASNQSSNRMDTEEYHGGYSYIVNQEFHDMME